MGLQVSDKSISDLIDMFAGYALSGYVREGVSYSSRKEECMQVASACYDLGHAMVITRQQLIEEGELFDDN